MLLYAISRFIIEFYRGDERGTVGMFSTSQFISILLAPLAIAMLVYLSRAEAPRAASGPSRAEGPRDGVVPYRPNDDRFPTTAKASASIGFSSRCCRSSRGRRSSG